MIPERPADRASDLIMMNQSWEKLSGHQPFLSAFTLHSNSMNNLDKAAKHNSDAQRGSRHVAEHIQVESNPWQLWRGFTLYMGTYSRCNEWMAGDY